MSDYRAVVHTLAPFIRNVDTLLKAVDAMMPLVPVNVSEHDKRVATVLASPYIMECMRDERKILAIKELRALTLCGLKEAKDAVEDRRVMLALNR